MKGESENNSSSSSESEDGMAESSDSGSNDIESLDNNTNAATKITYHLNQEKSIALQKNYICHMCGSDSLDQIAVSSSDFSSSLFDLDDIKCIRIFEGHSKSITNLRFNPSDPHQLVSSSVDGTIRFWDTRKPGKSSLTFKDDTAHSGQLKPFLNFDISKSGHFLCAGTELFEGDAFLVFGDARSGKVMGGYWESHSDDITQVSFNPTLPDCIASGSSDGLMNIYDLKKDNEDDALVNSLNTETSVDKLMWTNLSETHKGLSCILDTMDVQMWNQDDASPFSTFSRKHIAKTFGCKSDHSYVVNTHQTTSGNILLLTGASVDNSEHLSLLQIKGKDILLESKLPGNKQRVRCSVFIDTNECLVTAGECGIISIWKPGTTPKDNKPTKVSSKKVSIRSKPY